MIKDLDHLLCNISVKNALSKSLNHFLLNYIESDRKEQLKDAKKAYLRQSYEWKESAIHIICHILNKFANMPKKEMARFSSTQFLLLYKTKTRLIVIDMYKKYLYNFLYLKSAVKIENLTTI